MSCLSLSVQVAAPAKAGALAPVDVFIDAQNTGLGPEKTSFFQALSIPTKIARGTIEILVSCKLINFIKQNMKKYISPLLCGEKFKRGWFYILGSFDMI